MEKDEDGTAIGRRLLLEGQKEYRSSQVPGWVYRIKEARVDNGKGGTMPAPHVVREGLVAVSADDALAEQKGKAGKLEAAEDFLMRVLGQGAAVGGPNPPAGRGAVHRWRTLESARRLLQRSLHEGCVHW